MGKIIEWKKEEANNKVIEDIEEDSLLLIHQFVKAYYEDEKQEEIHPYEINGFEVGLISYLNLLEKGLLPSIIKNINVLAVNKFDRLSKLFPEVDIPQEFYIGFLKGFCSIYDKYM
ncbi:hypothetical protein LL033_16860 [Clostridium estertheticum]|uniref:hypothetical protein n=1 Tax=Clostridium estertheticum TaxID=238834 RepID=UPI001C0B5941|nr:hypothetical protein [Clostridium estertheticum]MBU3216744.1 hypothetical protein [Clostridium estertheticum]WAG54290.1 hypothetical protein LL033_16860 [Clostridium estertheticum]